VEVKERFLSPRIGEVESRPEENSSETRFFAFEREGRKRAKRMKDRKAAEANAEIGLRFVQVRGLDSILVHRSRREKRGERKKVKKRN